LLELIGLVQAAATIFVVDLQPKVIIRSHDGYKFQSVPKSPVPSAMHVMRFRMLRLSEKSSMRDSRQIERHVEEEVSALKSMPHMMLHE
jgi:hypothetical protein